MVWNFSSFFSVTKCDIIKLDSRNFILQYTKFGFFFLISFSEMESELRKGETVGVQEENELTIGFASSTHCKTFGFLSEFA